MAGIRTSVWLTVLFGALAAFHHASPSQATPIESGHFLDHEDGPILEALSHRQVVRVSRGRGGRSLSFRITLDDGTHAYFKPNQSFDGMSWYAEIAAYHLDRELGLGRVPPTVGRRIAWSQLEEAAREDHRTHELTVDEDGTLRGALIWWVPEPLVPLPLEENWERWLRITGEPDAVTPFQRPNLYREARRAGAPQRPTFTPEPDRPDRPAELSDLMVFDYLAHNLDRWGTDNTNVRTVGSHGPLMFLDNGASFTLRRAQVGLMERRLAHVQRFRRSTIEAVRALDVNRFAARLEADPLGPVLDRQQLENLETRRQHLLAHVDALIEAHGEDAVLAW